MKHRKLNKKRIFKTIIILFIIISSISYLVYNYYYDSSGIKRYRSKVDKDNDGVDDQTDILRNVKKYISKKPVYKSKYYKTGYPNDKYGVCTDVVGYGLLNSGYDLRKLVNEDIENNRQLYDIDEMDINIDFRRVENLLVYFNRYAIKLTTDITKVDQWQGGDIIIFETHIGIISDKRNKNKVPYLIHHTDIQDDYEEDLLENRNDIVAHFRIS